MLRVGVISDTHGLLRPEALAALAGVDYIVHAGDIGSPQVLAALRDIAPVTAVRGNNDKTAWAAELPDTAAFVLGGVPAYLLHDANTLTIDPVAEGYRLVISGHSHLPSIREVEGVTYLNPGSAGPRRFRLPVTLAVVEIGPDGVTARIVPLLP